MSKIKTILITGHEGFIGSNFVKFLKKKKINFEIFNNKLFRKKNLNKYSHIFHFAFKKNLKGMKIESYFDCNLLFTKKLILFAKKNNIQLIFPSTPSYFPSIKKHKESDLLYSYNLYSFTKILCEKIILKQKNLNFIILRIFNVYGEGGSSFLEKLKFQINKNVKFMFNENDWIIRDFINIQDLFKVFEFVIFNKLNKKILNLGSGKSYSLKQIVNKVDKRNKIKFSNNIHFTPSRPVVSSNNSKLMKFIKFKPNKNIYSYFSEKKKFII
tara:strand:- start:3561 stop:4370 length:810 start_codon:yes stop_codon:yes gene_type:complete